MALLSTITSEMQRIGYTDYTVIGTKMFQIICSEEVSKVLFDEWTFSGYSVPCDFVCPGSIDVTVNYKSVNQYDLPGSGSLCVTIDVNKTGYELKFLS